MGKLSSSHLETRCIPLDMLRPLMTLHTNAQKPKVYLMRYQIKIQVNDVWQGVYCVTFLIQYMEHNVPKDDYLILNHAKINSREKYIKLLGDCLLDLVVYTTVGIVYNYQYYYSKLHEVLQRGNETKNKFNPQKMFLWRKRNTLFWTHTCLRWIENRPIHKYNVRRHMMTYIFFQACITIFLRPS